MDPSALPELDPYPSLRRLVGLQIDMQFRDLRTMLQLPRRELGLDGGCNFAAARQCFDVIAGASVLFYDASMHALHDRQNRGKRFKGLLAEYYPWIADWDSLTDEPAAELLYATARNPLAHSLGVVGPGVALGQGNGHSPALFVSKEHLDGARVAEIAQTRALPAGMDPTIRCAGDDVYTLFVPTLTWGIHRMLERLFGDEAQATRAEQTARQLLAA